MEDGLYIGIDTHKEFHAFCALDERGAVALEGTCAASEAAYEGLCRSLEEAGRPARVAIEGSSSYGRGLSVLALPQNQPNAPLCPAGGAPGSRPGALPHFGRPRYLGPPPRARSTAG